MDPLLLLGRTQGIYPFDRDAISPFHLVHEVVGFGKQEFGIQGEETKIPAPPGSHVDQGHAFCAEGGRDRHCLPESVERPFEDPLGSPPFRGDLQFPHFFFHAKGSSLCSKFINYRDTGLHRGTKSIPRPISIPASSGTAFSTKLRSANLTASPTTSSVGDASLGARGRSATEVRWICCSGVVAREIIAQGVSCAKPAAVSWLEISP